MFSFRSKSRIAVLLTSLMVAWTILGGLVLAAEGEAQDSVAAAQSVKGPVWAMAYIVVLLLVGLGVFSTVRGSKRRDRAKPADYAAAAKH